MVKYLNQIGLWVLLASVLAGCNTVPHQDQPTDSQRLVPSSKVKSDTDKPIQVAQYSMGSSASLGYLSAEPKQAAPPKRVTRRAAKPAPRKATSSKRTNRASSYVVRGKRYHVRRSGKGYRKKGRASWYGRRFHGRKTASGARYNMYAMTAAHKTLPLSSYVRVTHLKNRRSVVVKINDRGPYKRGRIIDLSYAAAKRLGMLKKGTARVEVVALRRRGKRVTSAESLVEGEKMVAEYRATFSEKSGSRVSVLD